MSDLFHEKTPQPWQIAIFEVMAQCPQHAFQILTKRPAEMLKFMEMTNLRVPEEIARGIHVWPLPNVWLGVSVEDQKTADERIPLLLQTPAAVRWVSYEPALGPVDFTYGLSQCHNFTPYKGDYGAALVTRGIDWMVAGGESGPGARPSHPYWFRTVRDQCLRAVVPFFFKQWGEWIPVSQHVQTGDARLHRGTFRDGVHFIRLGKKYAGHLLDGREWREFPISHQSPVTSHGVQT